MTGIVKEAQNIKLSDYGYAILQIETQSLCDMRCTFCPFPLITNKGASLEKDEVLGIIDSIDALDNKLEYICFSQFNEPLLDTRIFDFIKYAKAKGFKVLIATNGLSFKSEELRNKLIEAAPDLIKLSVQTINKERFSKTRGVDYSFEEYIKGIFFFLESALKHNSSSIITIDIACNFLHKKQMLMRAFLGLEHGDPSVPNSVDQIRRDLNNFLCGLHQRSPSFEYDEGKVERYLEDVEMSYKQQEPLVLSRNIQLKIKQFAYGRRLIDFYPAFKSRGCPVRVISVLATGAVAPCCLVYDDKLTMGNIRGEQLKFILERNRGFIRGIKKGLHMPRICRICKGAPTKRGAIALSIARGLKTLAKAQPMV